MILAQGTAAAAAGSNDTLVNTAWAILDAAYDVRDTSTVEVCRRVIDAIYRGDEPRSLDLKVVFDFFQ